MLGLRAPETSSLVFILCDIELVMTWNMGGVLEVDNRKDRRTSSGGRFSSASRCKLHDADD